MCTSWHDRMLGGIPDSVPDNPNTITLDHEKYYQAIFFTVFKLIGAAFDPATRNIKRWLTADES